MFIEIKGDSGIYQKFGLGGMNSDKVNNSFYINLNLIISVSFHEVTDTYFDDRPDKTRKAISLGTANMDIDFTLCFDKEGMGEYNRIKRIIEERLLK
jgi:hypothetical protein